MKARLVDGGNATMAHVVHPRWQARAFPSGFCALTVDGDLAVSLYATGERELLAAWDHMRAHVGGGPTAAEVRDAIMACREVLREEVA